MYVRKKYMVQKSFRLDEQVEKDISVLAQLTGKSQNELVNCAIAEFLRDNKSHFLEVAILEHFDWQLNSRVPPFEDFEMGTLTVQMKYNDEDDIEIHSFNTFDGKKDNEYTAILKSDCDDEFDKYMRRLSIHIDSDSEDVKKYLDGRTDYSDYIKVK